MFIIMFVIVNIHSSDAALFIYDTSLKLLGLDSLKEIRHNNIVIMNNIHLCYAANVNWTSLLSTSSTQKLFVKGNQNSTICGKNKY